MSKPLKPLHPSSATGSLAEFVMQTAILNTEIMERFTKSARTNVFTPDEIGTIEMYGSVESTFRKIASTLPNIKRLSYDDSLLRVVHSTRSIDTEDMIGQLSHVSFPFDRFWIEGVIPTLGPETPINWNLRCGVLITANQDGKEFSFTHVWETKRTSLMDERYYYVRDHGIVADTLPISVRVSMGGINLDEERFLKYIEALQKSAKTLDPRVDVSFLINDAYNMADFLTRTLAVLSSPNVANNFRAPKTREELNIEVKNKRRKDMGFAPILPVSPIKIDLAQINPRLLETETAAEVRQLLGWTSVRRSREVRHPDGTLWLRKKDGKPWTRKPHDRKIAAPVDKRNAEREIFSSDPNLAVSIDDGRPVKVRHDGTPTDKPAPSK